MYNQKHDIIPASMFHMHNNIIKPNIFLKQDSLQNRRISGVWAIHERKMRGHRFVLVLALHAHSHTSHLCIVLAPLIHLFYRLEARRLDDFGHLLTCCKNKHHMLWENGNLHGFALAKRQRYQTKAKPSNAMPTTISHLERKAQNNDELN